MTDTVDLASELVDEWQARCLARVRRELAGAGPLECEACGEVIPPRRREVQPSAARCAPCQALVEARRRG